MPSPHSTYVRVRFEKRFAEGLTGREIGRRLMISAASATRYIVDRVHSHSRDPLLPLDFACPRSAKPVPTIARHAQYVPTICVATDADDRLVDLVVLAVIAWHQPITRDGLKEIFGRAISRRLIG